MCTGVGAICQVLWMGSDITAAIGICALSTCTASEILKDATNITAFIRVAGGNLTSHWQAHCAETLYPFNIIATVCIAMLTTFFCLVVVASVASWSMRLSRLFTVGCDCGRDASNDGIDPADEYVNRSHEADLDFAYRRAPVGGSSKPNQSESSGDDDYDDDNYNDDRNGNGNGNDNGNGNGGSRDGAVRRWVRPTASGSIQDNRYVPGGLIIDSFSLQSTYRQLLVQDFRPLAPLQACGSWRPLGHVWQYGGADVSVVKNRDTVSDIVTRSWFTEIFTSSLLGTDVFLVLSGSSPANAQLVRLKAMNRRSAWSPLQELSYGVPDIPRFLFYRLLRLIPAYAVVLLIFTVVSPTFNEGPLHSVFLEYGTEPCRKLWWSNLLLINNLYPQPESTPAAWWLSKSCLPTTWFVAMDWQLCVASPLFVLLFWKKRALGWCMVVLCAVASIFTSAVLMGRNPDHVLDMLQTVSIESDSGSDYIFNKPWARAYAYFWDLPALWVSTQGLAIYSLSGIVVVRAVGTVPMWRQNGCPAVASARRGRGRGRGRRNGRGRGEGEGEERTAMNRERLFAWGGRIFLAMCALCAIAIFSNVLHFRKW